MLLTCGCSIYLFTRHNDCWWVAKGASVQRRQTDNCPLTRFKVKQGHTTEFRKALTEMVSMAIRLEANIMSKTYQEETNRGYSG